MKFKTQFLSLTGHMSGTGHMEAHVAGDSHWPETGHSYHCKKFYWRRRVVSALRLLPEALSLPGAVPRSFLYPST